jgi:hypothetical protein
MNEMSDQIALSAAVTVPAPSPALAARGFFRRVYDRWRRGAHAVGVVQTRGIMFGIYLAVVVPTGALMRLFRDPLHLRAPEDTNWTPVRQGARTVEAARQQF